MTRKEISDVLTMNKFTYYNDDSYGDTYVNGEMEIFIDDILTTFYMGSLEKGLSTSLRYRNDELYNVQISNCESFENLKKLTIVTNAGVSEMYFEWAGREV